MRRSRALTCIEVVASLVLVATTATALLYAQGRSLLQLKGISEQQIASDLAEELITAWKLDPPSATSLTSGTFESHPGWSWQKRCSRYSMTTVLPLEQIELRVLRTDPKGESRQIVSLTWLEQKDEPTSASKRK